MLCGAAIAVGGEAGHEAPVGLGRTAARHGTLQVIEVRRALHLCLDVVPSRRRIRARYGFAPSGLGEEHARWRGDAAILYGTLGGVGVESRHVVSAAMWRALEWMTG